MQVNMHEAKSQLSKLGEKAWEGEAVVIAKAGKPYLDLVPHRENVTVRKPGRLKGQIVMSEEFDHPLDEIISAFEGDV
jgi:antitoxin (DNA-binding transcriptional repressor) of toxin-antitoxin stability system